MKCFIEKCVNNVKNKDLAGTYYNEGITYHMFPKDPELRDAWLVSLSIPKVAAYYRRVICSNHFKEDDFFLTKQGKRKLKNGAVPFLDDCYGPAALRICKICLSLDAKMYQLNNFGLDKMYQDIMGIPPRTDDQNRLPMSICWECTARLQSAASFKSKALFSDELLQDHLMSNADLKIIDIQKIHQEQTNLKSSIAVQEVFKFNSDDDEEHAPNTFIKTELIAIPNNEEIEVEVETLVSDKMTIKEERTSKMISNNPESQENLKTEIVQLEIGEETNLDDYYDGDDYETVTENVYIEDTNPDSVNNSTSDEKVESDNVAMDISKIMDTNDEELMDLALNLTSDEKTSGSDDEGIKINLKDKRVVCLKKMKKKRDDEVIIWVKGRAKKKQPYVKPSIPIDENIFSMHSLNHDELKREILQRRDSAKYRNSPYKCEICYRGFPTQEKRDNHVLKHSEKCGPIKCDICLVRMKKNRDLRAHMKRQHTTEFICKLCPMKTRNRNVALGHMKYHAGNKYECPQCFVVFEKHTTLLNHLRLKHMSAFVCELCGYTFVSKNGVDVHKRMKHKLFDPNTIFKGPHCDVCEVKFLTEKAYNRHLRLSSKHIKEDDPNRMSNDPSIKQRRLGKSFMKSIRRPVIHPKSKSEAASNGPVICEQCGVELESLRVYVSHFRYAHPGVSRTQFTHGTTPYMCEHCGKLFANTTTLACHMWVHTGKKLFKCDHCNKAFSIKANLAGHMRQHEGVRRLFACNVCGKEFTFSYNLTRHMFLHTGLRPFKCDACEKTFRTSGELRAHVDHVHLKKPRPKRVRRKANKCEVQTLEY